MDKNRKKITKPTAKEAAEGTTFVFTFLPDKGFVLAGRLVMSLEMRNPWARFTYAGSYLARPKAYSLDPHLPLTDQEHNAPVGFVMFSGLRDAAPDGWGRHLLNRAAGTLEMSEFDYLVRSGDDRVGALAFGPTPEKPERVPLGGKPPIGERFSVEELQEIITRGLSEDDYSEALKRMLYRGSSGLGGARPKGTAYYNGRLWLAKFSRQDDSYSQPLIEFANMSLAAKAGLDVPALDFLTLPSNHTVFMIERFDRKQLGTSDLLRTPFISGLSALGAHESDYNRWGYEDLAAFIFKEIPAASNDLRRLFQRMIFNVFTGNTDDHLRNHGFLFDAKKAVWRLSPVYDVVPQAGLVSDEKFGFLKLGDGRQQTIDNALAAAPFFQLSSAEARSLTDEIYHVVKDWRTHFAAVGVSAREIDALGKAFSETEGYSNND
ncbi:MAG: type II toxin-antitoxin system HipA family toxin [Bdellovibrionota bacterium]